MIDPWWLVLLPGSAVLVGLLAHVVKKGNARAAAGASLLRRPGDLSPGPAWLKVSTVGDGNLGISDEQGDKPSGTPTLQSRFVLLQVEHGPLVAIEPGHKLRILSLAGAQRQLVETVTTASSTIARYSFEVPPGKPFFIAATLPQPVPQTSPFRGQPQPAAVLQPVLGEYRVNEAGPEAFDWVAITVGATLVGSLGPAIPVGALLAEILAGPKPGGFEVALCIFFVVTPAIAAIAARSQYPRALTPPP